MALRPRLSPETFLASVFHPSKNPTPSGIRKTAVKLTGGRASSRVRSYNKMSAKNQEILRQTGQRDSYLKGKTSVADARRTLRQTAIDKGIAKPVKATPAVNSVIDNLFRIANDRPVREGASSVKKETIEKNVRRMNPRQRTKATNLVSYADLREEMDGEEMEAPDGANLLWYK